MCFVFPFPSGVSVGNFVNQDEVNRLVTDSNQDVYSVTNFIDLPNQALDISDGINNKAVAVCGNPVTGTVSTTTTQGTYGLRFVRGNIVTIGQGGFKIINRLVA